MTKIRTLQIYRGTTAQNDAYTGSAGELTMDTTTNELRIHDGSTAGGHKIGGGSSYTAGDGIDITSNVISATGVKNKNTAAGATNPVYDWVGTLAEYEAQAVATNHPDWVCYITDDQTADAYEAYTKSQSNNLFVAKGHEVIEFQEPTSANNYTWYRKYADGWVEQGGIDSGNTHGSTTRQVNLPVEMADTQYCIQLTKIDIDTSGVAPQVTSINTTYFNWSVTYNSALNRNIRWYICGMAA